MAIHWSEKLELENIETPALIIDEQALENNGRILQEIQEKANCKILLALKAYAAWKTFPIIRQHLAGVCAGSLYEARLGREEFGKEVHTYLPAVVENESSEVLQHSDYLIFNSFRDLERCKPRIDESRESGKNVALGMRVNPEKDVLSWKMEQYAPCARYSRLGVTLEHFKDEKNKKLWGDINYLHMHALCEQGFEEFKEVYHAFCERFDAHLKRVEYVNFGGGHHFTRNGYDHKGLVALVREFRKQYPNIREVYFEPGEAVVWDAGVIVASVCSIVENEKKTAFLDTSVESHFPDVLITRHEPQPYVPEILGAIKAGEFMDTYAHHYILGGQSCAAGDVFGEYSFSKPLREGDKLVFPDTAHYSSVKMNGFCGVGAPTILLRKKSGELETIKKFGYKEYKERLS